MSSFAGSSRLLTAVETAARSAGELSEGLELGLAERPLSRHFELLSRRPGTGRPRVCVALLDPGLRADVAAWAERAIAREAELEVHSELDTLTADPGAFSRSAGADLLIVGGSAGRAPCEREREAIAELIAAIGQCLPVVIGANPQAEEARWWEAPPFAGATSTPILLPRDADHRLSAETLQRWRLRRTAIHALSATRLLASRFAHAQTRLASCRGAVERRLRTLELELRQALEARTRIDELRTLVQDELQGAAEAAAELIREETLPDGALTRASRRFADSVRSCDLRIEPAANANRILVDPELVRRLREGLRQELRARLRESLRLLWTRLGALEREIARQTADLPGAPPIHLPAPEESVTWRAVDELLAVEIRYRGEMPRRSFMKRLMEGRRLAYVVLIFLSLFGGALSLRRSPVVAAAMPILFFAGVAHTYRSWKQEDEDRLEKEVLRVRDGLAQELRRTLADAQREKSTRVQAHLAALQRQVARQLDALARDRSQEAARELERQRMELRDRLAAHDQQQRQLQALTARVAALQKQIGDALTEASAAELARAEGRRA